MTPYNMSANDQKYFIDGNVYNCPFCKRKNVKYKVIDKGEFDWSMTKKAYFFITECQESKCKKTAFHLSNYQLAVVDDNFLEPPSTIKQINLQGHIINQTTPEAIKSEGRNLDYDEIFFYHQPTSGFTIDERIPADIKEPLSETDNCRKSNFLTGASACLRKAIYKLLKHQQIPEMKEDKFIPCADRIDLLKKSFSERFPGLNSDYLDHLKAIHGLTSQELHENDWEDLNGPSIAFLQEIIHEILHQVYVVPSERIQIQDKITALQKRAQSDSKDK